MTNSPSVARNAAGPRVSRRPFHRYSQGDDVADQVELAGLVLDDWQRDVLRVALGERDDGKWSAFEVGLVVGRQQGKGAVLEARALAGMLLLDEELVLWSAHEYKTAMEMFRRVRSCVRKLGRRINENLYDYDGIPIKVNNTNGEEGFERLDTEQRIQFVARTKNAGRGFSADCLIWDEAFALVEDQVDAQMPLVLARSNSSPGGPQIWYTSSPPLNAVSGAQLFRVRHRALDEDDRSDLAYFEWSADGCLDDLSKIDLDDRDLWRRVLPSLASGRVTEESVQRLRNAMSDMGFAREVLCIWPPDLGGGFRVIPAEDWAAAEDPNSRRTGQIAFAAAVSLDRKTAAIAACSVRPDGRLHVEVTSESTPHGVELDNRAGTGWVVPRLKQLVDRHKPVAVVLDEFGPTGSLIPDVEQGIATLPVDKRIEVTRIKLGDVGRAWGMFYDGVSGKDPASRNVRHIGQSELTAAVAGATKRAIGDATAWDRKNAAVDITPLVAVTNALWGYVTRPQEQEQPFFAAYR